MTTVKEAVSQITSGKTLSFDEAASVMDQIMNGESTPVLTSAYLTALAVRGETTEEIAGSAFEMRNHATKLPGNHTDALEIVGTGGDRSGSFNISTTSAFVIASAGVKVAKHGNRAASSKSGAADVLEALGANIETSPERTAEILDESGFCFMFAQKYHSSMKYVAPVRKELGIRTVFNILGPLTNPAFTKNQFSGVFSKDIVRPFAEALVKLGTENAMVVHGMDGLDEISVSGDTYCCESRHGTFDEYSISPVDFGMRIHPHSEILGGDPAVNAAITRSVLSGKDRGAKRDAVLLNSAGGLYTAGKVTSIEDGIELSKQMIDSGAAEKCLNRYVACTEASE